MYFHFASLESPTQYNLYQILPQFGLQPSRTAAQSSFSDVNLSLDERITQCLEYKHLLLRLLKKYRLSIMPPSFPIDAKSFSDTLNAIANTQDPWILKPAMLNNGEGIELFENLNAVWDYFIQGARYDGPHLLQRYIDDPHLLNGHKYSFRLFLVITNFCGHYLYRDGYFNVCRVPYIASDLGNKNAHLTNEHLNADHSPNNYQIPTTRCPNFESIEAMFKHDTQRLMQAFSEEVKPLLHTQQAPAFCLFGIDFMLDESLRSWLLEVNHGPCFPKHESHPLYQHLYREFWQRLIESFILPIARNQYSNAKPHPYFIKMA